MRSDRECTEIITAVERKYTQAEKLSFFSTEHTFSIYRKNKLIRVSYEEIEKLLMVNRLLLNRGKSEYDIIAEYLLNRLNKKNKPFPDIQEFPAEHAEKKIKQSNIQ